MRIGIFYGSTNGCTESVSKLLRQSLLGKHDIGVFNIAEVEPTTMSVYDFIILGSSTWGYGDLQDDWIGKEELDGADLEGKPVAIFGLGDQEGFGETFVDAMGILAESAKKKGAKLIGRWATDEYDFLDSKALDGEKFVGLVIDDDNQEEKTTERISLWIDQVKRELEEI